MNSSRSSSSNSGAASAKLDEVEEEGSEREESIGQLEQELASLNLARKRSTNLIVATEKPQKEKRLARMTIDDIEKFTFEQKLKR